MVCDTLSSQDTCTHQIWNSYLKNIGYAPDSMQLLETRLGRIQGHSDSIMVCNTTSSQDSSSHQILDFYLKYYKRYASETIILKTRSEVKVTVTRKWYVALRHFKMHSHITFGFPTSKNMRYALGYFFFFFFFFFFFVA